MDLIIKIAWRNVVRHKGKSIIIGAILFIGALLMTVGNGVIAGMDRGLEKNIVEGFLGDIVIVSDKEKSDGVLFKMMGEPVESFGNYKDIKKVLAAQQYVKDFLPVGKNASMVINEDEGDSGYCMLIGADIDRYREFFPGTITMTEAKGFSGKSQGIILPAKAREQLYDQMNAWYVPKGLKVDEKNLTEDAKKNRKDLSVKDQIVLMGMNSDDNSSDVRLDVSGVFRYRALNTIWGHFSIMDIDSYRQCLGYFTVEDITSKLPAEKKELLAMDGANLDAMFGSNDFLVADKGQSDPAAVDFKNKSVRKAPADPEIGAYNLIFVKLKNGRALEKNLKALNKDLAAANLGVHAVSWKKASGVIGSMAVIIKGALFTFVLFLFFVAVIIIVNTLTMAAIERSSEIGMMRAIGAHRSFISGMFFGETAVLSFVFGGLGVIAGIAIVKIIPLMGLTTDNDFVQLIYGGDTFQPFLSAWDVLVVIIELAVVTFVTAIYPVKVATSITPLDAISRD
jgi:putative ABC transport system permease protein